MAIQSLNKVDTWLLARVLNDYNVPAQAPGASKPVLKLVEQLRVINWRDRETVARNYLTSRLMKEVQGFEPDQEQPQIESPVAAATMKTYGHGNGWVIIHGDDLAHLPKASWLVPGEIPERALVMLYGQSGHGKSFLALDYALSVAQTESVVYGAYEGESGYAARVAAWSEHHKKPLGKFYICLGAVSLIQSGEQQAFISALRDIQPKLVVVDTLAMAMIGADENSARDMGAFVNACREIRNGLNCTVMLVHHANKAGVAERGSSAIRGACDVIMRLNAEDDLIVLECSKMKDAAPFEARYFKLMPVKTTVSGEAVESPVIIAAEKVKRTAADPLTQMQQKVLDALLMEAFADGAELSELTEITQKGKGEVLRALSSLIALKYVEQPRPRAPYVITQAGRDARTQRTQRTQPSTEKTASESSESSESRESSESSGVTARQTMLMDVPARSRNHYQQG